MKALLLNAYEYLEVEEGFQFEMLRKAYLMRAKMFHPDHGGSAEDFLNLQRAYEILKNHELRDRLGTVQIFQCPQIKLSLRNRILMVNLERIRKERTEGRVQ